MKIIASRSRKRWNFAGSSIMENFSKKLPGFCFFFFFLSWPRCFHDTFVRIFYRQRARNRGKWLKGIYLDLALPTFATGQTEETFSSLQNKCKHAIVIFVTIIIQLRRLRNQHLTCPQNVTRKKSCSSHASLPNFYITQLYSFVWNTFCTMRKCLDNKILWLFR